MYTEIIYKEKMGKDTTGWVQKETILKYGGLIKGDEVFNCIWAGSRSILSGHHKTNGVGSRSFFIFRFIRSPYARSFPATAFFASANLITSIIAAPATAQHDAITNAGNISEMSYAAAFL